MASAQTVLLSPAELSYLHTSLSLTPPIRPDGRAANQFRQLVAETGVLPGANGSARICFADGTEAIVGVKAEVEESGGAYGADLSVLDGGKPSADDLDKGEIAEEDDAEVKGEVDWVELTVEIPGFRDDDAGTVYLAAMLAEAVLADGQLAKSLYINRRFHWKLYIDVRHHEFPCS
jgi:exosome complex component RRP42